jgi:hypothetical protein
LETILVLDQFQSRPWPKYHEYTCGIAQSCNPNTLIRAAMHIGSDGWRLQQNCKNHRLLVGSRVRCMRAFLKPGRIFPQKTLVAFSINRSLLVKKVSIVVVDIVQCLQVAIYLFLLYDTFRAIRLGCFFMTYILFFCVKISICILNFYNAAMKMQRGLLNLWRGSLARSISSHSIRIVDPSSNQLKRKGWLNSEIC